MNESITCSPSFLSEMLMFLLMLIFLEVFFCFLMIIHLPFKPRSLSNLLLTNLAILILIFFDRFKMDLKALNDKIYKIFTISGIMVIKS